MVSISKDWGKDLKGGLIFLRNEQESASVTGFLSLF